MNRDEYLQASRNVWEEMAQGWDEHRDYMWETSKAVGLWMVENLKPDGGQTVLELAAGMGDTGFVAAKLLGPEGRLISTDFAPEMVSRAERRATELGISNAEFRVLNAEAMDLESESVDGVMCRWGYMLMGDPAAALGETRRVLRSGGRLVFSVFAGPDQNPWAALPAKALIEEGLMQAPAPGSPGIMALGSRDRLENLVRGAGFAEHTIEDVPLTWRFESFDVYWQFLTEVAGAIAMLIAALPAAKQSTAREAIKRAVADFDSDSGIALPGVTLNVVAH
jgi:ubiquinone/menaquinone biosynthesis C-methylase UbiE